MWNLLPQRKNAPGIVYVQSGKGSVSPADYSNNPITQQAKPDYGNSPIIPHFCCLYGKFPALLLLLFFPPFVGIPIKSGGVFACAQHPAFGRGEGGRGGGDPQRTLLLTDGNLWLH